MNIPEGYALVPVEPTEEMLNAGIEQEWTKEIYVAMVNAAPAADLNAYDEAKELELFNEFSSRVVAVDCAGSAIKWRDCVSHEELDSCMESWIACAKSRARSAE